MFRRHVIGAAGASAVAAVVPHTARAQAKTFKLGIVGRADTPEGVGLQAMIERIKAGTDGRITIEFFPSGALGGEREMLEGLQLGSVDLAYAATAVVANFVPEMQIFDIPFLFRDFAHAAAVLEGPIGEEYLAKLPARNLQGLAIGGLGFRQLTNSKRAVNDVADVKGLKIRTMENQIHLQAWRTLGALPTPMALPEVFPALQQGTVDGQENPVSAIIGNRFNEVQKFVTMTRHAFTGTVIAMSPTAWKGLSPADQALFRDAARLAQRTTREQAEARERAGIDRLKAQGLTVIENVDHAKFQAALAPAYQQFAQRFGEAAIARIRDAR
ncbi:MAG: TRAP transporter substrate-binding protein DctP [Alphaproteobacteria bacterium]|nr:TRAP transporter substrate-binding protein DctP [Alphaproteobacteria bacterium]